MMTSAGKLHIGLILTSTTVPAWQIHLIKLLRKREYVDLIVLRVNNAGERPQPDFITRSYLTFEKFTARISNNAFDLQDARGALKDLPVIPKAYSGMLYLVFHQYLAGKKLYPDCVTSLKIKIAQSSTTAKGDKALFEKITKRSHPRISRKGKHRCKLGLRDLMMVMPRCQAPQSDSQQ